MEILKIRNFDNIAKEIIQEKPLENPYMYIDSVVYGFDSSNIETYALDNYKVILYHYYNDLQIFQNSELSDDELDLIVNHIKNYDFGMISGNKNVISLIAQKLKDTYIVSYGYIMKKPYDSNLKLTGASIIAQDSDLYPISQLICGDSNIGGHYTVNMLYDQLLERKNNKHCQNVIIKDKQNYVAHAATYADIDKFAIIGGVITNPLYRNKGYGKMVLNDLTYMIQEQNKIPILYCYTDDLKKWYEKLGWIIVSEYGKLEKR